MLYSLLCFAQLYSNELMMIMMTMTRVAFQQGNAAFCGANTPTAFGLQGGG